MFQFYPKRRKRVYGQEIERALIRFHVYGVKEADGEGSNNGLKC